MPHTTSDIASGKLAGITRLTLRAGLTEFPTVIYDLADSLEILDLSGNKLNALPDDFSCLSNLRVVFLSENAFVSVPRILARCKKLEMIGFKSNQIKHLAEDALPESTRWLILTDNCLERLPSSMGKLLDLKKCMLAGNQIKALPDAMQYCRNLELLRISANALTQLPRWLFTLPKLRWLAFAGNPLNTEPRLKVKPVETVPKVALSSIVLGEQLGEGASGNIYRACWQNKDVAVKVFKGRVTSDGFPSDELRASLLAKNVPYVVSVLAELCDGDTHGVIMALIPDNFFNLGLPPSFATCTRDTFDPKLILRAETVSVIAVSIARALSRLHENGILNGDLYAHNILINDNSDVLLSDFGAATCYTQGACCMAERDMAAIQAIDVRAYGCLLDDLLRLADKDEGASLKAVKRVRDATMDASHNSGVTFKRIISMLKSKEGESECQ